MKRVKKTSKTGRRPRTQCGNSDGARVSRQSFWRATVVVSWLLTFSAVAYGLHRLQPVAQGIAATQPCRLEWEELPDWLADPEQMELLAEIEQMADLRSDDDIYARDLCAHVAAGLAASPWVSEVHRVAKRSDGLVRVNATFRKPLTMVLRNGLAYLVDENGVRLPGYQRESFLDPDDWIVIEGVRAGVPELGQRWEGADLVAGLKLARFLYKAETADQLAFRSSLRSVDVSNWQGRRDPRSGWLQIRLLTPNGRIHWGLPPGEEHNIEGTAERKLAALASLYGRQGGLPAGKSIDVRAEDRVIVGDPD
ncbi:MAG: hypothetical protein KKB50_01680 [Planctomycetes bacterium]|nr:hypothetical protein [Planctomycetota bacterium]